MTADLPIEATIDAQPSGSQVREGLQRGACGMPALVAAMSYARFTKDSDVYVFLNMSGRLECCNCGLAIGARPVTFGSTQAMVDHLARHVHAGDRVPEHVVPELWVDDAENFGGAS